MNKLWSAGANIALLLFLVATLNTKGYAADSKDHLKGSMQNDICCEYVDALHYITEGKRKRIEGETLMANSSRRRKILFPYWKVFDNTSYQHNENVDWVESVDGT